MLRAILSDMTNDEPNAITTTGTEDIIRTGRIVHYHGSKTADHGLYKVTGHRECSHGVTYDITPWFSGHGTMVLSHVRPGSVTRLSRSDIKTRKCPDCECEYFMVEKVGINVDGCPMCALEPALGTGTEG